MLLGLAASHRCHLALSKPRLMSESISAPRPNRLCGLAVWFDFFTEIEMRKKRRKHLELAGLRLDVIFWKRLAPRIMRLKG